MNFNVLLAFVLGMAVGGLPNDGVGWAAVKLTCAIIVFVAMVVVARSEYGRKQ